MNRQLLNSELEKYIDKPVFKRNRFFLLGITSILFCIMVLLTGGTLKARACSLFTDMDREIIIVLDPGHGGENEGTTENGFCEKEMTLITAMAAQEYLSSYEGVTVYLTRTDDTELTLAERAEFAASVHADFLFSLHFNASECHELFGAEIWVPLEAPYNVYGYQFGYTQLTKMRELGLYIRGIKTKRGDKGDYYGILRESVARNIPAVLIEHCHVDEARDSVYCDTEEKLRILGRADGEAIAEFLGLKDMEEIPECYSYSVDRAVASTLSDASAPDVCLIEAKEAAYDEGWLTLQVEAYDDESPLMSYAYSLDGGETFSERYPWPGSDMLAGVYDGSAEIILDIPDGVTPRVVLRAYNQFELYSDSNMLSDLQCFQRAAQNTEVQPLEAETGDMQPERGNSSEDIKTAAAEGSGEPGEKAIGALGQAAMQESITGFLVLSLLAAGLLLVLVMLAQFISRTKRHRHRR